jgi:microsomal dipeptidase-like Zn-dependent dipeptidase
VRIGKEEAWDHICIGSDFDGLVNFIDPYNSAEKLMKLREDMIRWFPLMADSDGNNTYYIDNNNVEKRVDAIMYKNANRFLQKNFN